MATALVVGGTGPTGPHVLEGLVARGFDVSIYHRGTHEPAGLPDVEHIHGDPHFRDQIESDLGRRSFDVVLAAYGRTRYLADVLRGRAGHFLTIGGPPRYAGFYDPGRRSPAGLPFPVREDADLVETVEDGAPEPVQFSRKLVSTERDVYSAQPDATYLIYPIVYGPRNIVPLEWSVIQRVLDHRSRMVLPDGGLAVHSRGAARNLAQFVLLAIDRPETSKGHVFNCADDVQLSLRQWVETIVVSMNAEIEIVKVPSEVAPTFRAIYIPLSTHLCDHDYLDTSKARDRLGYKDVIHPHQAIAESVAWYLQNPVDIASPPAAFVDRFDYALEDQLISTWNQAVMDIARCVPQIEVEEVHPMPHPKQAGRVVDERAR